MNESIGGLFGDPGVGKTYQLIDTAIRYCNAVHGDGDFLIGFYDFDNQPKNRALQCIKEFFGDYTGNFDLVGIIQTGKKAYRNKESKRSLFGELEKDDARVDYLKTYEHLHKTVFPHYLESFRDYDFLIVDALFPTIRKDIGKEVWKSKNPDRGEPGAYDWGSISPIEAITYNKFVVPLNDEDDPHNIPVLISGTMADEYKNGVKSGQVVDCNNPILKAMTYYVELSRAVPKKRKVEDDAGNIQVVCPKSTRMPWKDVIEPFGERDLLTILTENGVVEV